MLIGLEGGLGDGKTIMMVRYLNKDFNNGHDIYANFELKNGLKYNPIDLKELLSYKDKSLEFTNATLGIDEITVFVDCRTSSSKSNRIFSYFVLQSRKRSVNIYYTTQDLTMLEKRLLPHTHIIILCESIFDKNGDMIKDWKNYSVIDYRNRRRPTINSFDMNIKPYYDFYDTDEVIEPLL